MSQTIARGSGSGRITKATCDNCRRTVHVFIIDGARVETDPEIMSVVLASEGPTGERPRRVIARRVHGELCDRYKREDEIKAMRAGVKLKR